MLWQTHVFCPAMCTGVGEPVWVPFVLNTAALATPLFLSKMVAAYPAAGSASQQG